MKPVARVVALTLSVLNWTAASAFAEPPQLPAVNQTRWAPEHYAIGYGSDVVGFGYGSQEKILPVRTVGRGNYFRHFPTSIRQISPHWTWRGKVMDVDSYMDAQRVSGVMVLRDGAVALERYGLGRNSSDRWESMSATKSVTSILVAAAVQDGYIKSISDPVIAYIPELRGSAYDGVTIRQLLTMSSGVRWNEDYVDERSDYRKMSRAPVVNGVDPYISYLSGVARADAPGSRFVYKGADPDLAAIIVVRATGRSASEYLSEKIWQPYGMEADAFWVVNSGGHETGDSSLLATLRDFARIGEFMLEGGMIGDAQVFPPGWIADATSAHEVFASPTPSGATGYGYFWWIYKDHYAAIGHGGQLLAVYPKDKVVIAVNSAWPEPENDEEFEALSAFVDALHAAAVARPVGAVRTGYSYCGPKAC